MNVLNIARPSRFPGYCAQCGKHMIGGEGFYTYERDPNAPQGKRGRPEGTSRQWCYTHKDTQVVLYDKKGNRLDHNNDTEMPEPTPKPSIPETTKEDTGSLGDILKQALEAHKKPKEATQGNSEGDTSDDAETLAKMLMKLAGKGTVDASQVKQIFMDYAKENRLVNEAYASTMIREALKAHSQTPATVLEIKSSDGIKTIETGLQHEVLPDVLAYLSQGLHVYLPGPAGSGKTTIGEQCAKALGKPFYSTGAVDSKYALIGFKDAHGNYQSTVFRKAFEEGGLFLFDEMDASSANALLSFNAALANGHMDFPDGIVKRHPDFVCIAAANTFGHGNDRVYVGRNQLDAATLDRFVVVPMGYDEKLENAICGSDPKAMKWVKYVQATRKAVSSLQMRYVISPRASLQGSKMLMAGMDKEKVLSNVLYRSMKPEDVAKVQNYTGAFSL